MGGGKYQVFYSKKTGKSFRKLPRHVRDAFYALVDDLEEQGPVLPEWQNYSKLGENKYHCHLSYSWVACWRHEKGSILIEVYYVGSRENAPY